MTPAATEVLFPPLSKEAPDSVGVLSSWFVREGESVDEDQVLGEVQVDKVSAEVVAPSSGTVHLLVAEEAEVKQGSVIATISTG
jgi:pyruvate/2-oxoglutarate dehydrogenase complex dihydrolipoamide acyltransferase (E2) component